MSNEMRLIDANALIAVCRKTLMTDVFPNWRKMPSHEKNIAGKIGEMFKKIITNATTVDAKPVVHGRWELWETIGITFARCSVCGDTAEADDVEAFSFCPNCGADMRERSEGE